MPQISKDTKILYPELSYEIYGLCFNVHNTLGRFRSEKSYADAFEELLKKEHIVYVREKALPVSFVGEGPRRNIPDFIIEDRIIIDFKAKRIIEREDYYQMRRYLSAYSKELGLIINFQQKYLSPKRVLALPNSEHSDNIR